MEEVFSERSALPNQGQAFQEFLRMYPLYLDTLAVDHIREEEYPHLTERSQVCLDYMGVGLFSHSQQADANSQSAALGLAYISANLATHALYTAEETEMTVRRRVLRYMNLDENEYAIVFTANKLSAFKLLGESYPFHISSKLLLGYDHRCETQDALAECAKSKGATVVSANLAWPSLKLDKADVRKKLVLKRKAKSKGWGFHSGHGATNAGDFSPNSTQQQMHPIDTQGIMAYPVTSCGSGAKNSLQWIREAAQNGWHVLLDVSGLGAKAMDTLGLNLFHPDFIVGSFYKVFGSDPTGFGCLVIKKSVIRSLGDSSRARAIGMVRIVSTAGTCSSTSTSGSWDSFRSNSSSAELQHRPTPSAPLPPYENEALNAQFEEKFSTKPAGGGSPQLQSQKKALKAPRPRDDVEALKELVAMKDVERQEEASKQSWVRSQSSPSQSKNATISGHHRPRSGSMEYRSQASLENEEGEIVQMLKPSRSHRRIHSEALPSPHQSVDQCGAKLQQDGAATSRPLEVRAKEAMTGLRYLQIPKQVPTVDSGFLSRDFGKKSPLMLTLPKGFDSPGNGSRTPPLSKHEARQEFLVGSLPDTPSSVSAPCSPRCHRPRSGNLELPGTRSGIIVCRGLNLADKIGLSRINFRLRALVNWLISSLRKLRHSTPGHPHVVLIYGPLCQNDRSSTFSFNIAGSDGHLLDPVLVQRLADRNSISLGTSLIQGCFTLEADEDEPCTQKPASKRSSRTSRRASGSKSHGPGEGSPGVVDLARQKWSSKDDPLQSGQFSVLCASLCFLSSFTDAYRVLEFAALFLDADFVHREIFHYRALNQQTILM